MTVSLFSFVGFERESDNNDWISIRRRISKHRANRLELIFSSFCEDPGRPIGNLSRIVLPITSQCPPEKTENDQARLNAMRSIDLNFVSELRAADRAVQARCGWASNAIRNELLTQLIQTSVEPLNSSREM
jgi:hypothetical protein